VRDEGDLSAAHRRTRQTAALLHFDISRQTQIGTAVSEIIRGALERAGGGSLDFSFEDGAPAALCIRIEHGPAKPAAPSAVHEALWIQIARNLTDNVEIGVSAAGGTTVLLRKLLPPGSRPIGPQDLRRIREVLENRVPKTLVAELQEQNRALRAIQRELVISELSLRQRIRQSALLAEVAAALMQTDSVAARLQRCAEEMIEQLDVACALIWIGDPKEGHLELTASAGKWIDDLSHQANLASSQIDLIARERKPYVTHLFRDDPYTVDREWAAQQQIQAFAGYPLAMEDGLMGVLAVYAHESLAPDTLDTLRLVASQIAVGLDREYRVQERERLLESEHAQRLKAEGAKQARDNLLRVVSHDLRNPLSSVVTSAALLMRSPAFPENPHFRKHVQTIIASAERMKRLISDLLDLASIEAGHLFFDFAQRSATALVDEVIELHSAMAEAKSLRLEGKSEESIPDVRCDRGRILQALSNLVGNAIKFTPQGGAILVRVSRQGSSVLFAVTDTGPGISDQDLAHVFEPFWQAKPGAEIGVGLGLSIAKRLVESHGGKIWVESRIGHGSSFFVSLPARVELTQADSRVSP
jgi:signal transduction histidine kinase